MRRDFTPRKRATLGALGLLVAADIGLAVYSWHAGAQTGSPQQTLVQESQQLRLLKADIERAQKIRTQMPTIQQDCDRFEKSLASAASGYSTVESDLGEVSRKAGVKIAALNFHQKEVPNRPVSRVELEAVIEGDYASVVRFLNGLQKSPGLYIVNDLSLASSAQNASGALRVNLHLETYFRTTG